MATIERPVSFAEVSRYHESGHVLIGHTVGRRLIYVTTVRQTLPAGNGEWDGVDAGGHCEFVPWQIDVPAPDGVLTPIPEIVYMQGAWANAIPDREYTREVAEREMMVDMGGIAAHAIAIEQDSWLSWGHETNWQAMGGQKDICDIRESLMCIDGDDDLAELLWQRTLQMLRMPRRWQAVERLAKKLHHTSKITGLEADQIIE